MRNVRNNRAVRRLAVKSFRENRTRNIIAAIAIALTAILFTAVFTVGLNMVENAQRSFMRQAGGDAHGAIKELNQETYDILKQHPSIHECGRDIVVAYEVTNPEFLKRHVEMHFLDGNLYPHWFIHILAGKAPQTADEILLDQKSMELLGLTPAPGCQVTLEIRVHPDSEPVKRTFTVSGVIESSNEMNVGFAIVPEAYLKTYAEEMTPDETHVYSSTGKISMHVIFSNARDIQEKLNRVITDSGFSVDASSPDYIMSNANWAYLSDSAKQDPMTVLAMGAALLLIMTAGYLIIYNIFQISIIRDIRYYGLLKTIGTTGRQIKRILRRQALWLCLLGMPPGLLLGFLVGKILFPAIVFMSTSANMTEAFSVSAQPWIFIGAAIFTVFTVLLSEWKSGRIAARVSPVEALHYTEQGVRSGKQKRTTDGGKLLRMAFSNLGRSKGRTAVVICSLSLTVVLMNSVYTVIGSINREGFLSKMILSEDLIGNAVLWNYRYRPYDEASAAEQGLSEDFVLACQKQESFADGGRIYMAPNSMKLPVDCWKIPDYISRDENGAPGTQMPESMGGFMPYAGYEEGAYLADLYGVERFVLSKMSVVEGETDPDVIWQKLQTGRYLLYSVDVDDDQIVIENEVKHHAGDKIILEDTGGDVKEYEIVSVIKRHSFSLTNRIGSHFSYYVSAEEFLSHCSGAFLMNYLFDVKEGREDEMEAFLNMYTKEIEPAMSYESRTTYEGTFQELIGMFAVIGVGLSGMIGLIGMLNFVNVIITSAATRKREFAMMEAIGMTKRQLVGMLTAEGVFYALLTTGCSVVAGTLFSLTVIRALGDGIWFIRYRFTLLPVCAASLVLLLFGALVPGAVYALRRKGSIVEEIREV